MMKLYAGVDTRQSPSGKLVLRTRKYSVETKGEFALVKHFLRNGVYCLTYNHPTLGYVFVKVDGQTEWGAGLTWKQAEKIAEHTIEERP
jgi:hypothetical protein